VPYEDAKHMPYCVGPQGERITLAQMPRAGLKRWTQRDKALVVAAVQGGLLSFSEACSRYPLYADDYLSWHERFGGQACH
jgi:hypothetical protein